MSRPGGGGGRSLKKLIWGGSALRSDLYPFIYQFFGRKDTPFVYLPLTNGTPFAYLPLENSTPLTYKLKQYSRKVVSYVYSTVVR